MLKGRPLSVSKAFETLKFYGDRRPDTPAEELKDSFCVLSEYRDGAIYLAQYAGDSEWERHSAGDEVVFVIDGETTLILLENNEEKRNTLNAGELLVVPQNTWHRFVTPKEVKVMTITPQPTDHQVEKPV